MSIVEKPWGTFEILLSEDGYQVKRIVVNPGHRLSYQKHAQRAEKWTITQGEGRVTLDGEERQVETGCVIDVPVQMKHRIQNTGQKPLVFIEVQLGPYLGEDDIVRLEDDYKR